MITASLILATASVGAVLITGSRVFGLRRIVQNGTKVDIGFTLLITAALAGTLTGIAAAVLAGLFMSIAMTVLRYVFDFIDRMRPSRDEEYNDKGWVYNQAPYV